MNRNISKVPCLVLLAVLITLVVACGSPEQPTKITLAEPTVTSTPAPKPIVQVIPFEGAVKERVIFTEKISQNNCGNDRDLPHTVERSQTIAYKLEVGGGIKVDVDGTIKAGLPGDLAGVEVSVGTEVATQYGVSYGKEETFSKSLTVVTAASTHKQFTIQHNELWETGELVITIGEWEGRYPYEFRRGFGLEQVDSRDLDCLPTPTPTTTPPLCPSGIRCYEDDFNELDPNIWCEVPQEGIRLEEGQLFVNTDKETGYELHPCEPLAWNLRFVELTLSILQATGHPGNAHSGIGASLGDDQYLFLQLDSAGNAVLTHGLGGEPSDIDATIPLDDAGVPHTLRVEWTGSEVLFYVDGSQLETRMASDSYGHWFLLTASAWPGASVVASFDHVRWGVSSTSDITEPTDTPIAAATTQVPTSTPTSMPTSTPTPAVVAPFFDDFNSGTIDTSKWDTSQLQYARVEDGHLYFDTPVNETVPWVDDRLEAEMSSETISRIIYTIKLDSPPGPNTGWLVLGTSCGNAPGWMGAYAGGPEGRFVIQYAPEGGDEGDKIYFESVADGRSHTIDLRWVGDSVQVYLDRQLQDKQIPCEGPAWYAQFGAGLNLGTQVSGYFDDISIWP